MRIVIDAGHGGADSGMTGYLKKYSEKEINLAIALHVQRQLAADGHKICLTRTGDVKMSFGTRAKIAHDFEPDVIFSIHCGSIGPPISAKLKHQRVLISHLGVHRKLANSIANNAPPLLQTAKIEVSFGVGHQLNITDAFGPKCLLIECGYISNQEIAIYLNTPRGHEDCANGICTGVREFLG